MQFTTLKEKIIHELKQANYPLTTIKSYENDIDQFFQYLVNNHVKSLGNVTNSQIEDYLGWLEEQNYAPRSVSRKIISLKKIFQFGVRNMFVEKDLTESLKHPKFNSRPVRILSTKELKSLRNELKDDIQYFAIIETLLQTGMKIGELANLDRKDITLIPGKCFGKVRVKTREGERIIPMNNALEEIMEQYLKERPKVKESRMFITKRGNPIPERNIRKKISHYFKLAGITDAMVNDLRNTFIAKQLKRGVSVDRVSYLVGYKSMTSMVKFIESLKDSIFIDTGEMVEEV